MGSRQPLHRPLCGPELTPAGLHLVAARGSPWRPTSVGQAPQHQVCTNFVAAADHECLSGLCETLFQGLSSPGGDACWHTLSLPPPLPRGAPRPSTASYARARAGAGKADSHNYCGAPGGRPFQRTLRVNLALTIAPQHSDWGTRPSGDTAVSGSTGAPSSRPFSEIRGLPVPSARSRGLTRTVFRVHWGVDYKLYGVNRPAVFAALRRADTPIKIALRAVTRI